MFEVRDPVKRFIQITDRDLKYDVARHRFARSRTEMRRWKDQIAERRRRRQERRSCQRMTRRAGGK